MLHIETLTYRALYRESLPVLAAIPLSVGSDRDRLSRTAPVARVEVFDPAFEKLLEFIKTDCGFDFTGYKRNSLIRRCRRRMQDVKVREFGAYNDYLRRHPDEFGLLFNVLLINVTEFFRDPPAWKILSEDFGRRMLSRKDVDEPIRIWSAGCASGEEAYTLLIVLSELIGAEECRRRVRLYATDADEEALAQARLATYPAKALEEVPAHLLDRYFEKTGERYVFRSDLRKCAVFGRHDLVQDAPIADLDLLSCRNTLMYFNSEVQTGILKRFHFALGEHGLLFLGRAEMLRSHASLFTPMDRRARIFGKAGSVEARDWKSMMESRVRQAAAGWSS